MLLQPSQYTTYSNILTKKIPNNIPMDSSMLVRKIEIGQKKTGEKLFKYEFNKEFWWDEVNKRGAINVTLDEIHTLLSARNSMSKKTKCMLDFLALIRRIIGQSQTGQGTLTLITQLERRIDVIAKEMCNQVRYHLCHYQKTCLTCLKRGVHTTWPETNEEAEPVWECPRCKTSNIQKHRHIIEVWHFKSMELFVQWKYYGLSARKTAYRHYLINDIEKYFQYYNTLQWDNLLSED